MKYRNKSFWKKSGAAKGAGTWGAGTWRERKLMEWSPPFYILLFPFGHLLIFGAWLRNRKIASKNQETIKNFKYSRARKEKMEFQDVKVTKAFSQRRGRKKLAQYLVHNVILMYLLILSCMGQDVKKSCRKWLKIVVDFLRVLYY